MKTSVLMTILAFLVLISALGILSCVWDVRGRTYTYVSNGMVNGTPIEFVVAEVLKPDVESKQVQVPDGPVTIGTRYIDKDGESTQVTNLTPNIIEVRYVHLGNPVSVKWELKEMNGGTHVMRTFSVKTSFGTEVKDEAQSILDNSLVASCQKYETAYKNTVK